MPEKRKFLLSSSPDPESPNSKFYQLKILSVNIFSLGTFFSASICKIKEVKGATFFYVSIVKYWNICFEEYGFFSHSFDSQLIPCVGITEGIKSVIHFWVHVFSR